MSDEDVPTDPNMTTGSPWNHWICESCWSKREPSRWPVRVRDDSVIAASDGEELRASDVAFVCCFCSSLSWSHILIRDDPDQAHCHHDTYVTSGTPEQMKASEILVESDE